MDLVKREDSVCTALADMENTKKMSEALMRTPHYAKLGQEGIYAIVAKAKSIGMDPVEALNGGLYFVQGKVGMSAEAMAARMRSAGHSITKDPKSTSTNCILNGKRGDNADTWQVSFSVEDAKRAGIYNERGPWGKYPQMMCYNRAISMLYRQLTPDLSKGIGYGLDELKEISEPESKIHPINLDEAEVKEVVKTISSEQSAELLTILENCEPEYIKKLWATLSKPPISIQNISLLPEDLFDRIKTAALNNQKVVDPEEVKDLEDQFEQAMEAV